MTPTETGLYGCPSDFPADFVTIDQQIEGQYPDTASKPFTHYHEIISLQLLTRRTTRDQILDLAEDLDARGLVLCSMDEAREFQQRAFDELMAACGGPKPSSPNTGS